MRIRIQTYHPLPDVKAWFVPDAHNIPENVRNLKDELCRRVEVLKDAQYHGRNLMLFLDDFELLDDSPFSTVRDGDLICIKQRTPPEAADKPSGRPHGQKRKRSEVPTEYTHKEDSPARKSVPTKPAGTSSQAAVVKPPQVAHKNGYDSDSSTSSSSSSSSSSTSSSSSSSSTSSTSSASSSSSSASSSPPKPQPSKKVANASSVNINTKAASQVIHVPPGLGKASTHARNERRRNKRESLKEDHTKSTVTLKGASEANSLPLGLPKLPAASSSEPASIPLPPSPSAAQALQPPSKKARIVLASSDDKGNDASPAPVYITQDQVMMGSMRNKNKKKGFKLSMSNPIPQKITFDASPAGSSQTQSQVANEKKQMQVDTQPQPSTSASASTLFNSTGPAPNARLIPPSEIQERGELPPNMFVTSVDVEAGMWGDYTYASENGNGKAKKGKKKVAFVEEQIYDDSYYGDEGANDGANVRLDYSEGAGDGAESSEPKFDWERAEKVFETSPIVSRLEQLTAGVLVGWKDLGIDPRTFSPETMLYVARVIEGPDSASGRVTIRTIRRGGDSEAAFAFGLMATRAEEDGEKDGIETHRWITVLGSESWRVLNM